MGFTYQELKSIKKKSIILEKQENLEVQQNSSKFRERKHSFIRERFYGTKEEDLGKSKERENFTKNSVLDKQSLSKRKHPNSKSKTGLFKETDDDHDPRNSLYFLNSGKEQQQEIIIEKVLDTSQQLSRLEESIKNEIKNLKLQRDLLKGDGQSMGRKRNKKLEYKAKEPTTTWAEYLEDNNSSREGKGKSAEISKEKFSLQHQCVCTSPRYGSDQNLFARPRMRSVASQVRADEVFIDHGALGDYNSATILKSFKDKVDSDDQPKLKCSDTKILKQNDQIVNCCYVMTCPNTCQQTAAATNDQSCQHYSRQQNSVNGQREYTYCHDEYYYNMPNCSCNAACRRTSKSGIDPQQYRRHVTDLNTQNFYYRPPEKTEQISHKSRSNSKKKTKTSKTNEALEDYSESKKRGKQQRSKSESEQRLSKSAKLSQLLNEKSALKLIEYLDRYVDDCEKEIEMKKTQTPENIEASTSTQTTKIKSHTKFCKITIRKNQQVNTKPQDFKDSGDSNSMNTQNSWETLRMLKKMTIREYKLLKRKEESDLGETKRSNETEKAQRYREYLDKFESEQKAKKSIKVLKPAPEYFREQESELFEKQISKEKPESRRTEEILRDPVKPFEEPNFNSSLINNTNFSFDQGVTKTFPESDSYEELRYEYAAAARNADSWHKYKDQGSSRQAKYDPDVRKTQGDMYYQDNSRVRQENRRQRALIQDDKKFKIRGEIAENQRSQMADKQKDISNYRKCRDRERRVEDPRATSVAIPDRDFKERSSKDQRSKMADDLSLNRKSRDEEGKLIDSRTGAASMPQTNFATSRPTRLSQDSDFYRKFQDRERQIADPTSTYYEDQREDSREINQHSQTALEWAKVEPEDVEESFEQSRQSQRERKPQDQSLKQCDTRNYNNESNLYPIVNNEANYDEEAIRPSRGRQGIPQDQRSRYKENSRSHSKDDLATLERATVRPEYSEEDRDRERNSKDRRFRNIEDKYEVETFRQCRLGPQKSDDKISEYFEDTRSDFKEISPHHIKANYDVEIFKESRATKPRRAEEQRSKHLNDQRNYSIEEKLFPMDLSKNREEKINERHLREPRESRKSEDQSSKYFGDKRRYSQDQRSSYFGDQRNGTKDQTSKYYEDTEGDSNKHLSNREFRDQILSSKRRQEQSKDSDYNYNEPEMQTKIKDQFISPRDSKDKEILAEKYGEEVNLQHLQPLEKITDYKRPKRSAIEPSNYDRAEEIETPNGSSTLKATQINNLKQESPTYSYDILQTESKSTTSYQKKFQTYPLKQEPNIRENEKPIRYDGDDLKDIEKKSNSYSSYNDFKQVMDHSLGLYTSRASQTDYHFKPELIEQLSSLTFTREIEAPIDEKYFNENHEEFEETSKPETTTEALKYLNKFLKTYQVSGLEGECDKAVTSAANELIAKLSSCKSSLQTQSNYKIEVNDEDKASLTLEEKLNQDTQFKDPETTTDSSDPQIPKLLEQEKISETITAELKINVEDNTKVEPMENNAEYMEIPTQLPLTYESDFIEPCEERECINMPLSSSSRLQVFDPQVMPLKGILKPCRFDDEQIASYELETHRTTSVVSFGQNEEVIMQTDTAISFKQGKEELDQHCNEIQQTIISRDVLQHPIAQQTHYQLTETINTKQPIYKDHNQLSCPSAMDLHYRSNSPHLLTVELEEFKQCPCMLDTYMTMLNNYYKGKKK